MNVDGVHYRTIWLADDARTVRVIDQRRLPFEFVIRDLRTVEDCAVAIHDMWVRGAGLIGATAGYGMFLATLEAAHGDRGALERAAERLIATRPTAINLSWAVQRQLRALAAAADGVPWSQVALQVAQEIADGDADACRRIGVHGAPLLEAIAERKNGEPVNVLTHCNAGWLAFVDHGSATAPIYRTHDRGIPLHVWVDETRPRSQGARLTAWELAKHGVPHSVIADSAGGHLMQHGMVDLVITGSDRTTYTGDVANKIGTYPKALAAADNEIPFYVALPSSTFDLATADGVTGTPIEERDAREVTHAQVQYQDRIVEVALMDERTPARNFAFDVTPARLVTGLITERGICDASEEGISSLFPELWARP